MVKQEGKQVELFTLKRSRGLLCIFVFCYNYCMQYFLRFQFVVSVKL